MKLTGRPEAKLVVPSIGSTHHNHSFPSPFKLNSRASRVKEIEKLNIKIVGGKYIHISLILL